MKKVFAGGLALLLCLGLLSGGAFAAALPFTDVPVTEWYYSDVQNAVEIGLVNGKSPTTYEPQTNLTYAEAVKLAACMYQRQVEGSVTLKNGSPWYQNYVDYCNAKGIIQKEYNWDAYATRADYMDIFASALPEDCFTQINAVDQNAIPDVKTGDYGAESIYKLYRAGIAQGNDPTGTCRPNDPITRAEVAAVLTRMVDQTARKQFSLMTNNWGNTYWKSTKIQGPSADDSDLLNDFQADLFLFADGTARFRFVQGESLYGYQDIIEGTWFVENGTVRLQGSNGRTVTAGVADQYLIVKDYTGGWEDGLTIRLEEKPMPASGTEYTASEMVGDWTMESYTIGATQYNVPAVGKSAVLSVKEGFTSDYYEYGIAGTTLSLQDMKMIIKKTALYEGCANQVWQVELQTGSAARKISATLVKNKLVLLKKESGTNVIATFTRMSIPEGAQQAIYGRPKNTMLCYWVDPDYNKAAANGLPLGTNKDLSINSKNRLAIAGVENGVEVQVWSGKPIVNSAGVCTGWNTQKCLYESKLDYGQVRTIGLTVSEENPDLCLYVLYKNAWYFWVIESPAKADAGGWLYLTT